MGLLNKLGGAVAQGIMGNMSEVAPEELTREYGAYLMDGEEIQVGYRLVRDVVLFTDKRIIDIDKQGATGVKMRVDSIYLSSVIHVSVETAGFGMDDSEINIHYIASPYYRANSGVSIAEKKFEFPKHYNVQPPYKQLQEIAYENHERLNKSSHCAAIAAGTAFPSRCRWAAASCKNPRTEGSCLQASLAGAPFCRGSSIFLQLGRLRARRGLILRGAVTAPEDKIQCPLPLAGPASPAESARPAAARS